MSSRSVFLAEVFAEYAVGMVAMSLRFFARWKYFGIRNFDVGDLFAALAVIFYSLVAGFIYLHTKYGTIVGLNATTAMEVPQGQVADLERGSRFAFVAWIWYICLLWSLKAVLLSLYMKIGLGIDRQERIVQVACVFTACGFFASLLTHTLGCLPVSRGWQVKPYPGDECSFRRPNYIVIAALNAISDLVIILVPMPLLLRVNVPWKHKLSLIILFSLGFFVIVATILRSYYSLGDLDTLSLASGWASREMMIATIITAAPGIKPLLSTSRWFRGTSENSGNKRSPSYEMGGKFSDRQNGKCCNKDTSIVVERSIDVSHQKCEGKVKKEFDAEWYGHMKPISSVVSHSEERAIITDDGSSGREDDNRSSTYPSDCIVRMKEQI